MGAKTQEDLDLLQDAEREWKERAEPKKKGGRYVDAAYPNTGSKVRFGAKRFLADNYGELAKKPAPGPAGPPMATLQEEAARRRREQREMERGGGR